MTGSGGDWPESRWAQSDSIGILDEQPCGGGGGGVMVFGFTGVKRPELNPLFRGFRTCHRNPIANPGPLNLEPHAVKARAARLNGGGQ